MEWKLNCITSYKCDIKIGTKNYYRQTIRTLELEYRFLCQKNQVIALITN